MLVTKEYSDFNVENQKAKRSGEAPFKHWMENVLKRGDILPRGKYFKGKVAGKPIFIMDEFWFGNSGSAALFFAPPRQGMSVETWDKNFILEEAQKLDGKLYKDLNNQEQELFQFVARQGRKYGIEIRIAKEGVADIRDFVNYTAQQWDDYLRDKQAPIQVIVNDTIH